MKYVALLASLLFGLSVNGQGTHAELKPEVLSALNDATNVVLYSLDPKTGEFSHDTSLLGYKILGTLTLDKKSAKSVIAEVLTTIYYWSDSTTRCVLQPRHGLRIIAKGKNYIFLLCYQCGDIYLVTPTGGQACFHLRGTPYLFNQLFEQNKIPMAP